MSKDPAAAPELISCVVAVHNGAELLERAVSSILAQEGPLEVIIVDDTSTDATATVAQRLSKANPNVRGVRMRRNGGPGAARNTGSQLAKGPLLTFLDHDDEFLPGWFAVARAGLRRDPTAAGIQMRSQVVGLPAHLEEKRQKRIEMQRKTGTRDLDVQHNVVMRSALVPGLIWFPHTSEFRGALGGEDIAFMKALHGLYRVLRTDTEFHVYHCDNPNNHLIRYLSRIEIRNGEVVVLGLLPEESDGSFRRACGVHMAECRRRRDELAALLPRPARVSESEK